MNNIPERIYLNIDLDGDNPDNYDFSKLACYAKGGIQWCTDRQHDEDIEYLSKDYVLGLIEKIDTDMKTHSSASAWTAGFSSGLKILKEKL